MAYLSRSIHNISALFCHCHIFLANHYGFMIFAKNYKKSTPTNTTLLLETTSPIENVVLTKTPSPPRGEASASKRFTTSRLRCLRGYVLGCCSYSGLYFTRLEAKAHTLFYFKGTEEVPFIICGECEKYEQNERNKRCVWYVCVGINFFDKLLFLLFGENVNRFQNPQHLTDSNSVTRENRRLDIGTNSLIEESM